MTHRDVNVVVWVRGEVLRLVEVRLHRLPIPPFGTFLLPLRYKFSFHSFRSAEKQSHIVVIGRRASLVDLCVCGKPISNVITSTSRVQDALIALHPPNIFPRG